MRNFSLRHLLPGRGKARSFVTLLLTGLLAVLLLGLSVLFPCLASNRGFYADMTPEGLYTVSEGLQKELSSLSVPVTVHFCADPDYLLGHFLTRYPYVTAKKLERLSDAVTVDIIPLRQDARAADRYKSTAVTSIGTEDVIVEACGRYRVLPAASFFTMEDGEYVSYNGEYRLASAILSLTAYKDGPSAYFAVGHGESYYLPDTGEGDPTLSSFALLLEDAGLKVGKVNLDEVSAVPEDCVLLIFCGSSLDYSSYSLTDISVPSAVEKIDRYLSGHHSVMVFRDESPQGASMPLFDEYLAEWGFTFENSRVTDRVASLASSGDDKGEKLIVGYPDENSSAIGYSFFSSVVDLGTPPKTVLDKCCSLVPTRKSPFETSSLQVTRNVSAVFYGSSSAKVTDVDTGYTLPVGKDGLWLSAVGAEACATEDNEYEYAYVFGAGTSALIRNDYLDDAALGNRDVVFSILRTLTRTDVYASSEIGGFNLNANYGGKMFWQQDLSETPHDAVLSVYPYTAVSYPGLTPGLRGILTSFFILLPALGAGFAYYAVRQRRKYKN
ncbi:MAG: GldG family protein [Clostridia bacterium]|nr:GldG family protein [Clostridia bacterium]